MTIEEIKRAATRAAKRGDVAKLDELEIAYIKLAVPLTVEAPAFDGDRAVVPASPVRLFRGAGPNGETRVQWLRADGVFVVSDINGHLVGEHDGTLTLFPLAEAA
ncbi:hypothetical protein [Cupriavidus sp. RAF12]|uniref:hypothetical protein n=1 Tax=Cupriavidus sp. RAF12 TaxID=3233050 RepID=UPI003F930CF1